MMLTSLSYKYLRFPREKFCLLVSSNPSQGNQDVNKEQVMCSLICNRHDICCCGGSVDTNLTPVCYSMSNHNQHIKPQMRKKNPNLFQIKRCVL